MKKSLSLFIAALMLFAFSACSEDTEKTASETTVNTSETQASENTETDISVSNKTLVVYFSRTGENYGVGNIKKGNTHIIADIIAEETDADIFEIATVNKYPDSYDECTELAKQEQDEKARPEIVGNIENMEQYDTVFVGYPIWWGDMPMAVYTFLESYDFSDKTIIPFCTHEGSGLSETPINIQRACPDAKVVTDGFEIKGATAQNEQDKAELQIKSWLKTIK